MHRAVFVFSPDPSLVIKYQYTPSFQNAKEWDLWNDVQHTPMKKWLAPCVRISENGIWLLQKRTDPLPERYKLPDRVPRFMSDTKCANFGLLKGSLVCHDYANKRNVETIAQIEQQLVAQQSRAERWGSRITDFFGSLRFVLVQIIFCVVWIVLNDTRTTWFRPFDPYPFQFLSTIVGIEFIFLTTFVLMNQKYLMRRGEQWSHLHLQLSMLTEQEVTKNMQMLHTICEKLELEKSIEDEAVGELAQDTEITALVDEIEKARKTDAG